MVRVILLAVGLCAVVNSDQLAAQSTEPPPGRRLPGANLNGYWTNANRLSEFDRPYAGETGPIQDIRGMDVMRAEGRYVVYLGDYRNPVLQPWAADALRKHVEQELKGSAFHEPTPQEVCRSSGVPNIWTIPTSIQIVQTPEHVAILYQRDHQFRIVHMNQPHQSNVKPSYYGDSVGRWEDGTLVIDTIGQSDKTPVDVFNTPHTDKIRVIERFQLVEGAEGNKDLWIHFIVEDPGAFTGPWSGMVHFRPMEDAALRFPGPLAEEVCAENNRLPEGTYSIPTERRYRYPD